MNKSDLVTKVFQNIDSLNKNDIELGINQILEVISSDKGTEPLESGRKNSLTPE